MAKARFGGVMVGPNPTDRAKPGTKRSLLVEADGGPLDRKFIPLLRWVVERTQGLLSKCRAILVRYDKKACNYLGMIKVACALLWYRRCWNLSVVK